MHLDSTMGGGVTSIVLTQVQSKLTNITMQIQDMENINVVHAHVWCTRCRIDGHHQNECPMLGSYTMTRTPYPFPTRP
jgi:hypothetical protein